MKKYNSSDLLEIREMNKISLETYCQYIVNNLDFPIDKLISELKDKIDFNQKEYDKIYNLEKTNKKLFNSLNIYENEYAGKLDIKRHDHISDLLQYTEEIQAFIEVKIIYSFKNFEIHLKNLINKSYKQKLKSSYKWDNILTYLSDKGIKIKDIQYYKDVNQLRELNNSIKHSDNYLINENLKKYIPELNKENPDYIDLLNFYERIKNSPAKFIEELSYLILENLYQFDDNKIDNIANHLSMRMDKEACQKLIEKLKENYI